MLVFQTIADVKAYLAAQKHAGKTVGLVPTMGALHAGHISLVKQALQKNECVIASIFVNPTQFNNAVDLEKYPRTIEKDTQMLLEAGCSALFVPTVKEVYPELPQVKFSFGNLETVMEGAFRPGHFNGVGIVVSKLFNIVQPHDAYFGQKDLQQFAVINQMTKDLSFDINLHRCPILRESDGLAMSSRNQRLNPEERLVAKELYHVLTQAVGKLATEKWDIILAEAKEYLMQFPLIRLEYMEIANADTLQPAGSVATAGDRAICIAAFVGEVRLIDNIIV